MDNELREGCMRIFYVGIICKLLNVQNANAGLLNLIESALSKAAGKGAKLADEVQSPKYSPEVPSGARHQSEGVTDSVNFVPINSGRFLAKCREMEVTEAAKARCDQRASEVKQCLERELTARAPEELALRTCTR